ncbi:MAG: indolepyruvate oxidoreductase subunit beta [Syntrophobacterales bacterium]|nr:indolepyruvate oxidoreductase subunit beta [Syntrophobacterales bacterium]
MTATKKKPPVAGVRSILMAGVGGQGILRASDILCLVIMEAGLDVKKSEVHGMAQRGGCVTSHVRFGSRVYSPIERKGNVDILLAFEKLEALRYLDYLKPDSRIIVNDLELYPPAVNLGAMEYPAHALGLIRGTFGTVKVVRAHELAARAGNPRVENTVLLGVLSQWLDFPVPLWEKILDRAFPPKARQANIEAFHLGRNFEGS